MKISIAKVGQKIIFDRSSSSVDRSNANGNVGLYKIVKMLNDIACKDNDVLIISDNDISSCNDSSINVVDSKDNPYEATMMSDVILVIAGLSTYEKNDVLLDAISSSCKPVIILCEDPRCLSSMIVDDRFSGFNVKLVLWQTYDSYAMWHGKVVDAMYFPLQVASAYEFDESSMPSADSKVKPFIVVANSSSGGGSTYDRAKVVAEVTDGVKDVEVYGRLNEDDIASLHGCKLMGELKYNDMQDAMASASSMLLVPIESGWVTSKYVECLMNAVLPIFHADYAIEIVNGGCGITVEGPEKLASIINSVTRDKLFTYELATSMYKGFVKPYIDGKKFVNMLLEVIGDKLSVPERSHDEGCDAMRLVQ